MTINNGLSGNNLDLASVHDLSSFEPEAILASLPGEHPRMAAGLAIGREASQTGHLDVAELSKIASELYAEGFPAGAFGKKQDEIPSTASLSDAREPAGGARQSQPSLSDFSQFAPSFVSSLTSAANAKSLDDLSMVHLQYASGFENQLEVSQLLGVIDVQQQAQLSALLADTSIKSAASVQPLSASQPVSNNQLGSNLQPNAQSSSAHYFLQGTSNLSQNTPIGESAHQAFDANLVRKDFPILRELVNGRPLIWFDNAATTQKPQAVIDSISYFYEHENSNIHRAAHELAARATDAYEDARESVRRFINAPSLDNIVFVRGTTEAINLVAKTWGKKNLSEGDEIVISHLEHHANIVPWQQLCQETGAKLK